jgi:ADP-heptose:LPS heptosyltransferase
MATGMAKGAHSRNRKIAFGDGSKIIWDHNSEQIFRNNLNIATPGEQSNLEWIPFYKGHRIYNTQDYDNDRWRWNYDFHAIPGEIFMQPEEITHWLDVPRGYVIVEPNIPDPRFKRSAVNKEWELKRFQEVANRVVKLGYDLRQFQFQGMEKTLANARALPSKSFRQAMGAIQRASLVICSEGGLHHAAAAMGVPAVVLFGGFIPPQVTGYDFHANIAVGEACGKYIPCQHCKEAMQSITVDQVWEAVEKMLASHEEV